MFDTFRDRGVILKSDLNPQDSLTLEFNLHFQDNALACDNAKGGAPKQKQIVLYKRNTLMR